LVREQDGFSAAAVSMVLPIMPHCTKPFGDSGWATKGSELWRF
jgi:hypothetical protein